MTVGQSGEGRDRAPPVLPDYAGGGIVNLMASIARHFEVPQWVYPPLHAPSTAWTLDGDVLLIVVDGLGDAVLRRQAAGGALAAHRKDRLTSVFPSTTASAITTFLTGLAPSQHGLTGWHAYLEEIDRIAALLPFHLRGSEMTPAQLGLPPCAVFTAPPFGDRLKAQCHMVSPRRIVDTTFNVLHAGRAHRHAYSTLAEFFEQCERCLRPTSGRRFVYAYWPELDSVAHERGVDGAQATEALHRFDQGFERLLSALRGRELTVLVTGDHGLLDAAADQAVVLDDHPHMAAMLAQPLSGERRAAYCHVRPERLRNFEHYVHSELSDRVELWESSVLIEAGWFGPSPIAARLTSAVGDYTLLAKDRATVKDWLPGEKRYEQVGVHGGVSAEEMYVPLIVAQP